ncbi:lipase [Gordonia araii NBRC 100433]|nr:lipase [Gordonia araii NBRC 100433]
MLVAGLVAGVGSIAGSSTASAVDFYTPPARVSPAASEPGVLVRTQPISVMLQIPGIPHQWPGSATRVMYMTSYQDKEPVAATGVVIEPTLPWRGRGPRPTVVIGPGTVGQGDQCATSKNMGGPIAIDPGKRSVALNYTAPEMFLFLNNGVRVAIADYVGIGTPGMHTYLNRAEQGYAMIDAARAALKLASAPGDSPIAFSGYSQGGGAAAAAAELAEDYAPELDVRATYAGAPTADLISVINRFDGTRNAGYIGYVLNGLTVRYPEVRPILDRELNPAGKAMLGAVANQCAADTGAGFGLRRSNQWTRSGESIGQLVLRTPELLKAFDDQRIGKGKPNAPVLLEAAPADDIVPYGQVRRLYGEWRGKGVAVAMMNDGTPPLFPGTGSTHILAMLPNLLPAASYLMSALSD